MEREDNFRLKRFKELKTKKNKGDDDKKYPCYCDKKPGKGDDFICAICKHEQDKNNSKKKTCEFKSSSSIAEVIGDKASSLNTANQKRLDDLTAHLEKVISLTSQCKTEGLVSPSVDTFIYACREVRDKLEETCDKSNATESATCSACEGESPVLPTMPCNTCSESRKTETQQESVEAQDSFGCFETKYKEIVKVKKYKNEDGTVSEEKQVITVKTERKFPQNSLSNDPCYKIKIIDFKSDNGGKDDSCACKKSKSENIQNDVKRNQTNIRPCVSDSGDNRKISPSKSGCCKIFDASTNPKTPSVTSNEVCPKKSSSANASIKSKVSLKSSKSPNKSVSKSSNTSASKKSSKTAKKDECSECRVEITSVCCDSMWKDVACSTTGLAENSEEEEELCISIKESELVEPNKKLDNPSVKSKSSANKEELCCDTNEIQKKSSLPRDPEVCSKKSKLSSKSSKDVNVKKDASVTTSNIILIDEQEKPNSVKSQPCCNTANNLRKTDVASKTCCKIKIISKQKTGQGNKDEKVQEIIFFGSILDAVKKILAPNNSQDNIKKTSNDLKTQDDAKSCSCTSQNLGLPPKTLSTKFSAKSSVCKTCETASKVPSDDVQSSVYGSCKGMEKSQSCPQCHAKNEEKSISWSQQRSQSEQNTCSSSKCPKNLSSRPVCCGCKAHRESTSKCSVCGSTLSKSKSNATSFPSPNLSEVDKTSCISCNESYSSILKNNTRFEHLNNAEASNLCSSIENTVSKPTCKTYQTDRLSRKVQPKPSQKLSRPHSCPVCLTNPQTSQNQEIKKPDDSSCHSAPKAKPAKSVKSLCCGFTPRSRREERGSQKETPGTTREVEMVDASTSTRRSDRYDVRPLKMMKSNKQPTCTCHSDSYLIERAPRNPRRSKSCSSCHGDYYRKSNVLAKIVVPRLNETSRYITSELEEMEREEVFRLKRVKQKKELEKHLEELKRIGVVNDKGVPIKKDDQGPSPPPAPPPPPKKIEAKSPGGSKTIVNRPPETVNLLILNPRDEPGPMSVQSTYMPPFGGKTVPDIREVEEILDEKQSQVMESNLQSTAGVSMDDRSKVVTIHEEENVESKKLNESPRSVPSITDGESKGSKIKAEEDLNVHNTQGTVQEPVLNERKMIEPVRNLLFEMTQDNFQHSEEGRKQFEDASHSGTNEPPTSDATYESLRNSDLAYPLKDPGYFPIADDNKERIEKINESSSGTVTSISSISDDIKDIEAVPFTDSLISSSDENGENRNTGVENIRSDKSLSNPGTIEEIPQHKQSEDKLRSEEKTNLNYDESRSDPKDNNEHEGGIHIRSVSNVFRDDHVEGERDIFAPAKNLVSEVVKGVPGREESQSRDGMKDAETLHDYSTSNSATQYEDIEEEQDLKTASKQISKGDSKQFADNGTSTHKNVHDKQEDVKEDWEFVLANDQQGDDVDSKSVIKDVEGVRSRDNNKVSKDKISKEGSVIKPLRIIDSDEQRNLQSANSAEGDENDEDDDKKTTRKKRKKKKDGNEDDDSNQDASTKDNTNRPYIN